jgi:hypothetical protein
VEKHFRETHKENIVKPVETHTLSGTAARNMRSPELARLVRTVWEDQRRFPLQIATALSQQFAARGLQFFKVNRTVTHVSVARPHYLDMEATPVSEGVKSIVEFINAHPKSTRRQLLDALAPAPPQPAVIPVEAPAEGAEQKAAEAAAAPQPTPEQTAIIADLHWLVHQGHVIEFANGMLETAKKPAPKPPKPEAKKPEAELGLTEQPAPATPEPGAGETAVEAPAAPVPPAEPAPQAQPHGDAAQPEPPASASSEPPDLSNEAPAEKPVESPS